MCLQQSDAIILVTCWCFLIHILRINIRGNDQVRIGGPRQRQSVIIKKRNRLNLIDNR